MKILNGNKTTLSKQIVENILDKIKAGELGPGDKLPSEKELVEIYDVNRNSVREALRTLDIMNVIYIQQGKGAFVTSLETELLVEHLDFVFMIEDSAIYNLFEARRILEPEMAAIAAIRATDEEIKKMIDFLSKEDKEDIDADLHQMIIEITKNPILIRFMNSIWSLLDISRKKTSVLPGVEEKTYKHHKLIVNAIVEHDPELAKKYMKEHIDFIESSYLQSISVKGKLV